MNPAITIILCTRNRAESLRTTLQSIQEIEIPADLPTEIMVVDNGSTDHTALVIEEMRKLAPIPIFYALETKPGKSHAYNAGLKKARGNIFLSTDDDVRVPKDWVEKMCRPIFRNEADVVQGGILAASHLQRPWLKHSFLAISATLIVLPRPAVPLHCVGANFAFGRDVLNAVRGFDPLLGPGSFGGLGEDTLFGLMAKEAGFKVIFSDFCSVVHHFDSSRLEPNNVVEVARKLGRTFALIDYHWRHDESKKSQRRYRSLQVKLPLRSLLPPWRKSYIREWQFCYEMDLEYQRQMSILAGARRRYALRQPHACLEI